MSVIVNKTAPSTVLCPQELRVAINNDASITQQCENVTVDNEVDLTIYFVAALTPAEDLALDAIIASFVCPPGTGGTPPAPGQVDEGAGIVILNDDFPLITDVAAINFEGSVAAVDDSNSQATVLVGTIEAKNTTASVIIKGIPIYITGVDSTTNEIFVAPADAADPNKMPALGIAVDDMVAGSSGLITIIGEVRNLDTSSYAVGDNLYVAPGGGLTNIKPAGAANLIQKIAQVSKTDGVEGRVVVFGAGRSNDVPNIPEGYIWIGNSSGVATPSLLNLELLSNVNISGPISNNEVLAYDAGTGTWTNQTPSETDENITVSVAPTNTETVDFVDSATVRAVKWFVNITDSTANDVVGLEVFATHRNGTNPIHNVSSIIGDSHNIAFVIDVTMIGTNLALNITNNETTTTLVVDSTKIPIYV